MLDELIERYSKYSDSELMNVYLNSNGYTEDAKKALEIVVEERGGFSSLKERYYKLVEKEEEKQRVYDKINQLYKKGNTKNDINSIIHSEILSTEEIQEITDLVSSRIEAEKKDVEIKTSTYIGSILGGFIGGTIGGILWGLQLIYSGHIFYLFAVGLGIISYGFIKFFTKQSKNNIVVLILTVASVFYALILGFYIYELFGYRGPDR
ncbi:hypothetical protein [Chryseobacterium gambrini]|uniref:hypothetical protein n=1 Tax=Chryseobacterium gambrini TaxID=373672 RepID=UPI001A51EB6D|nr:hypothetical protein [Chryseobacterium gambrini]MBL7879580.1 hypothetical protein [Chryseobacterium gambrini]WBV54491.1 hypothetical protein PFY09_09225 [Chryseobacterium gambrini]